MADDRRVRRVAQTVRFLVLSLAVMAATMALVYVVEKLISG